MFSQVSAEPTHKLFINGNFIPREEYLSISYPTNFFLSNEMVAKYFYDVDQHLMVVWKNGDKDYYTNHEAVLYLYEGEQ